MKSLSQKAIKALQSELATATIMADVSAEWLARRDAAQAKLKALGLI